MSPTLSILMYSIMSPGETIVRPVIAESYVNWLPIKVVAVLLGGVLKLGVESSLLSGQSVKPSDQQLFRGDTC